MVDGFELLSGDDSLFASAEGDWWNEACLNWGGDGWGLYALGYKDAADLLVRHVGQTRSSQDTLVYPTLFLYRQYLELSIKYITCQARRLLDLRGGFPKGHDIARLWTECRRLLVGVSPGEPTRGLDELSRLVEEFASVDRSSQAFRYPADSKGCASLEGLTSINLRNVRDVVGKMAILLDGAGDQVGEYLVYKAEMESEYRP